MSAVPWSRTRVAATVQEVLPKVGLAFLVDEHDTMWTVTKSTQGPGVHGLRSGQRVQLTLKHHPYFSQVSTYDPQT